MREVQFRLSEDLRERLDRAWRESGVYNSRAEYLRHAVAEKLDRDGEG